MPLSLNEPVGLKPWCLKVRASSPPYWAARASLLALAGQKTAADDAYERAIGLEPDAAVRRFLQQRRSAL